MKGGAVYDDFGTAQIDPSKWEDLIFVREIVDGKLRLNVQAEDSYGDASIGPRYSSRLTLRRK